MFFVKCAWKDTRYCYHFSTFGPISMDCSQACKVFSSWRKQLDVVAGAACWITVLPPTQEAVLHVKFWLSIFSPSASWLLKQERGLGEQGWASCGVQITSEILGWTLYPRPPIAQHWSTVSVCSQVRTPSTCCFCIVLILIPAHILLSSNYSKADHFCLLFIFTAVYKGSCRM